MPVEVNVGRGCAVRPVTMTEMLMVKYVQKMPQFVGKLVKVIDSTYQDFGVQKGMWICPDFLYGVDPETHQTEDGTRAPKPLQKRTWQALAEEIAQGIRAAAIKSDAEVDMSLPLAAFEGQQSVQATAKKRVADSKAREARKLETAKALGLSVAEYEGRMAAMRMREREAKALGIAQPA